MALFDNIANLTKYIGRNKRIAGKLFAPGPGATFGLPALLINSSRSKGDKRKKPPKKQAPRTNLKLQAGAWKTGTKSFDRPNKIPFSPVGGGDFGPSAFPDELGIPEAPGFDPGELAAMLDAEYNPQIEALRRLAGEKRSSYGRADQELAGMYGALSRSMTDTGGRISAGYDKAQADINSQFTALDQLVASNYGKTRDEANAQRKMLGIEQAGAVNDPALAADQARASSSINQQRGTVDSALEILQQGMGNVTNAYSMMAQGAGANRRADLGRQLAAALQEIDMGVAELESKKAGQLSELMMQLEQQNFENQMRRYGVKQDTLGSLFDRQLKMQEMLAASNQPEETEIGDYLSGAAGILSGAGGNANRLMGFINEALMDPKTREGFFTMSPQGREYRQNMNPYQFAAMVVDRARAKGVKDNRQLNLLMQAAIQAFGNKGA